MNFNDINKTKKRAALRPALLFLALTMAAVAVFMGGMSAYKSKADTLNLEKAMTIDYDYLENDIVFDFGNLDYSYKVITIGIIEGEYSNLSFAEFLNKLNEGLEGKDVFGPVFMLRENVRTYRVNIADFATMDGVKGVFDTSKTYTIGAYCAMPSNSSVNACSNLYVYRPAEVYPLPDPPVKEGHTFAGWYLDENFSTPYSGQPITANTTLYAKFNINRYTVTYDVAGGSADKVSDTFNWNTAVTPPTPTREGYDFKGWFNGNTEYNGEPLKADTTLTAHWERITLTVTFMIDGEVYKTVNVYYGSTFQEVMQASGLAYYNLLSDSGEKLAKGETIKSSLTVAIGEMTKEEKVAAWISNNQWVLWTLGAMSLAFVATCIGLIIYAAKRR